MTPVEYQYNLSVDLNRASSFNDKSIIKKMLEGWRLHQVSVLGLAEHSPLFVDLFLARQSLNMKSFLITDPHLSLGNVAFLANNVAYYQNDLVFDFSKPFSFNIIYILSNALK